MSHADLSDAEQRVWARLPAGTREALADLSGSDLRTLLLSVARGRAATVRPADLMRRWRDDRFVRPAAGDPRGLAAVEARIWRLLPAEFDGVELSPVVPLGTCSTVAPVSQNRVVTTMRATEVLSDATNALAIEAATRRRRQPAGGQVHLAAAHRHLRAQDFGAGRPAHFRLFAVVSSARDAGSGSTQARLLALHLGFWRKVLAGLPAAAGPRLHYTVLNGPLLRERIADTVLPTLADPTRADRADADRADADWTGADWASADPAAGTAVPVVADPGRDRGREYYTDAALRITAGDGARQVELGDGGFTTWTGQLLDDAKERCLVSCLATERLAALAGPEA